MVMELEPGSWGVRANNSRFGSLLVRITSKPSSGAGSDNFSEVETCRFRPTVRLFAGGVIAGTAAIIRAGATIDAASAAMTLRCDLGTSVSFPV